MKVTAILLAAGNGHRFRGNKLLEPYHGKQLYEHTVCKVLKVPFYQVILVTQYMEIAAAVAETSVKVVMNPNPERGLSSSIQIGLQNCDQCDGLMFFVCDQPLLSQDTISGMLDCFQAEQSKIICASYGERRGNPVLFPYSYNDRIMKLKGDDGGRTIIADHLDQLRMFPVAHPSELKDIDVRADLLVNP